MNTAAGSPVAAGWRCDAHTWQFTYVSPEIVNLLGVPEERWLTERSFWSDHIHPEDRDRALEYCRERSAALAPYYFEYRMVAPGGRTVWVGDAVQVIAENGVPTALVGVMVDITDRKRREADEERSHRSLSKLVEQTPDAILGVSIGGAIAFANRTPAHGRLSGTNLWDHVAVADQQCLRDCMKEVYRTGRAIEVETTFDGGLRGLGRCTVRIAALRDEGRAYGLVMMARPLEGGVEDLEKRARRAERERVLGAIPDMIFRIRRDGTLVGFRPGERDEPALPPNQFLARRLQDVLAPDLAARVLHAVDRALVLRDPQLVTYSIPVPMPDGPMTSYEARLVAEDDETVLAVVRRAE